MSQSLTEEKPLKKEALIRSQIQQSKKEKERQDAIELMKRQFRAKCRFRALVRKVIQNLFWLIADEEVYEGDNVKKRVEQAMRTKSKKQDLLSLPDKVLLMKSVEERTEAEKRYIFRKIGGLKCFKRYPNHVKRKLAAATYFKYYGPNRVIVRQSQEAHALYFVVTGEVIVSVLIYDEILQKQISINVCVMHPGDMFGEVSLLHNINRTATCTTSGHCEFLALMKRDFKNVLQKSLQKQWDEVTNAMNSFRYFDGLDEVARREGCIVAKMKSYEPNETILGDGAGIPNFVYFVLSGRCQMIESLKIQVTETPGKKSYQLIETPKVKKDELDITKKYFKNDSDGKHDEGCMENSTKNEGDIERERLSVNPTQKLFFDKHLKEPTLSTTSRLESNSKHTNIRTYFMQVCIFKAGSTFGFGENMLDRRIVATTRVDCMLLPLMWLMQKNTANIWSRIRHFLEKKIPTKKQLFKEFVSQRQWLDWRDSLVEDIVSKSKAINYTTIHDVPYSIRMEEMLDI